MPIYDFTCKHCSAEFESLVLKETEKIQCPECRGSSVQRKTVSLFSCTGVQVTKRLKLDSEARMSKGIQQMKHQKRRKERIKIL